MFLHNSSHFAGVPGQRDVLNLTAIYSARQETSLQDLAGFWSYNESFDISKYEDFDHSKFLGKETIITNEYFNETTLLCFETVLHKTNYSF